MVMRRSDVSEVKRTKTDEFQERLLKREGIRPGTQAPMPLELDGWKPLMQQLSVRHPLMILERELGPAPEFSIGRCLRTAATQVEFHTFTGVAKWAAKTERLKYAQITCLRVGNRYLDFYQRHFERNSA